MLFPILLSLPHYSVMNGMHCTSCHYRVDGGGLRKDMGQILQQITFPLRSYGYRSYKVGDWLEYGMDARLFYMQYNNGTYLFPMQFSVYLHASLNDNFEVFVGKNLVSTSTGIEAYGMVKDVGFKGGYMRAGVFWPNVGLRYDDHSYFTRDYLDDGAANYFMQRMENGAIEVGYRSQNFAFALGAINALSNVFFTPDQQAYFTNVFYIRSFGKYTLLVGASALYQNVSYYVFDAYMGAGIRDWFALIGETQHYPDKDVATLSLRWIARKGIHIVGVYNAEGYFGSMKINLTRVGGGLSLFLLPNLEYQFRYYYQSDGTGVILNSFHLMF